MNKEQWVECFNAYLELMRETMLAKNKDYTGVTSDPFANFTRVEALGIASVEVGFLTRMTDKLSRINSFVQKGSLAVKSESVEDTLIDLANYSLLMAGYIKSKYNKETINIKFHDVVPNP